MVVFPFNLLLGHFSACGKALGELLEFLLKSSKILKTFYDLGSARSPLFICLPVIYYLPDILRHGALLCHVPLQLALQAVWVIL